MPTEYYDKNNPTKNQWVVTLEPVYNPDAPGFVGFEADVQKLIKRWRDGMNTTPIVTNNLFPFKNFPDPLVGMTFANHPDMAERFKRFVDGDVTALSEPGIVLLTVIGDNKGHFFE